MKGILMVIAGLILLSISLAMHVYNNNHPIE